MVLPALVDLGKVKVYVCQASDIPEGRHKGAKSLMSPVKEIRKPRANPARFAGGVYREVAPACSRQVPGRPHSIRRAEFNRRTYLQQRKKNEETEKA